MIYEPDVPLFADLRETQAVVDTLSDGAFMTLRAYAQRNMSTEQLPAEYVELELLRSLLVLELRRLTENRDKTPSTSVSARVNVKEIKEEVSRLKERLRRMTGKCTSPCSPSSCLPGKAMRPSRRHPLQPKPRK